MNSHLNMWVVFDHPVDFPREFVARKFLGNTPTDHFFASKSLNSVREWIRRDAINYGQGAPYRMARHPKDDPLFLKRGCKSEMHFYVPCECHACIAEYGLTAGPGEDFFSQLPLSSAKMILCPECGNKRCPKASDHRNECTGSNEPGQAGSIYNCYNMNIN